MRLYLYVEVIKSRCKLKMLFYFQYRHILCIFSTSFIILWARIADWQTSQITMHKKILPNADIYFYLIWMGQFWSGTQSENRIFHSQLFFFLFASSGSNDLFRHFNKKNSITLHPQPHGTALAYFENCVIKFKRIICSLPKHE